MSLFNNLHFIHKRILSLLVNFFKNVVFFSQEKEPVTCYTVQEKWFKLFFNFC